MELVALVKLQGALLLSAGSVYFRLFLSGKTSSEALGILSAKRRDFSLSLAHREALTLLEENEADGIGVQLEVCSTRSNRAVEFFARNWFSCSLVLIFVAVLVRHGADVWTRRIGI